MNFFSKATDKLKEAKDSLSEGAKKIATEVHSTVTNPANQLKLQMIKEDLRIKAC